MRFRLKRCLFGFHRFSFQRGLGGGGVTVQSLGLGLSGFGVGEEFKVLRGVP